MSRGDFWAPGHRGQTDGEWCLPKMLRNTRCLYSSWQTKLPKIRLGSRSQLPVTTLRFCMTQKRPLAPGGTTTSWSQTEARGEKEGSPPASLPDVNWYSMGTCNQPQQGVFQSHRVPPVIIYFGLGVFHESIAVSMGYPCRKSPKMLV